MRNGIPLIIVAVWIEPHSHPENARLIIAAPVFGLRVLGFSFEAFHPKP